MAVVMVDRVDHLGVMVADIDATVAWYVEVLGFAVTDRWSNHDIDMSWAHLEYGGHRLEFVQRPGMTGGADAAAGYHHLAVVVGDCAAATEAIVDAGATVVFPPAYFDRHDMDWSFVKDPFGNIIELVSYRDSESPPPRP